MERRFWRGRRGRAPSEGFLYGVSHRYRVVAADGAGALGPHGLGCRGAPGGRGAPALARSAGTALLGEEHRRGGRPRRGSRGSSFARSLRMNTPLRVSDLSQSGIGDAGAAFLAGMHMGAHEESAERRRSTLTVRPLGKGGQRARRSRTSRPLSIKSKFTPFRSQFKRRSYDKIK